MAFADESIGMGLQNFTPPIHISEPDFLGLIDPELLPEDRKLGPEEFEAVIRRQLQAFSQARLANVPAVRTTGDTDFLLFNTLKMVLLQVLQGPTPAATEKRNLNPHKKPGLLQHPSGSFDNSVVPDVETVHSVEASIKVRKNTKNDGASACCCCSCCGDKNEIWAKDGHGTNGITSRRRAHRRLLELEENAMSELVQAIAGPVRDRLLRDIMDPLGREVARLRAGQGLSTEDVSCDIGPTTTGPPPAGNVSGNDLVLLNGYARPTSYPQTLEKPRKQKEIAVGSDDREGGAWLFPRAVKERGSRSSQAPRRSANRRETTRQHRDPLTSLLCDIVDEAAQANAAAASTAAYVAGRSASRSGVASAYRLRPSSATDFQRRSAVRPPQQPNPSPGCKPKDGSSLLVLSPPQDYSREQENISGRGVLPSTAHNPGRSLLHSPELGSMDGGRNDMGCYGIGMDNIDAVNGGNMEEKLHAVGPGLMMHMRFSIAQ
jgi:hypothetical protein